MKKSVVMSLLVLAAFSLPSNAGIIGDFEGSLDGWEMQNGAIGTVSSFGATHGSNSLEVVFPGAWITVLKTSVLSYGNALKDLQTISFDVTTRNDNNQIPGWWLQTNIIFNSDVTGWKDSGNLFGDIPWAPRTDTLTWTVPQDIRDLLAGGTDEYAEIFIVTNTGDAGGTLWIDNIQMTVPEPATLSLLGLGAAILLRRIR